MLDDYEFHLLIVDRQEVDVTMNMLTAFIVIMFISFIFKASTWYVLLSLNYCRRLPPVTA